jgi:hypothetical protein
MPFSTTGAAAGGSIGTSLGPIGTALGTILGGFFGGGKKAPSTIYQEDINLTDEQKKALKGNLAAETDIEKLLSQANNFQQDQALSLLEKAMPGYGKLSSKLTSTADELLTNPYDVPKDVQANLQRIAAERGVSRGTRGQFNEFSLLRDLGVSALDYGQNRINQAQGITSLLGSLAPRVNPMSPLSFYTTPAQQANATQTNNQNRQEIAQSGANAQTQVGNENRMATWNNLNDIIAANADGLKMIGGKVLKAI